MGYYSWRTQDTNKSIANRHSRLRTAKVHMIDNKGNTWTETDYDGYGNFGGKGFYELLAEMNGYTEADGDLHQIGVSVAHYDAEAEARYDKMEAEGKIAYREPAYRTRQPDGVVLWPNLVSRADKWIWRNEAPARCRAQGYFYSR